MYLKNKHTYDVIKHGISLKVTLTSFEPKTTTKYDVMKHKISLKVTLNNYLKQQQQKHDVIKHTNQSQGHIEQLPVNQQEQKH